MKPQRVVDHLLEADSDPQPKPKARPSLRGALQHFLDGQFSLGLDPDLWNDMDLWQRTALYELSQAAEIAEYEDATLDTYEIKTTANDDREYIIFKSDEDAFDRARMQVEDTLNDEPELFRQEWLQSFVNVDRLRRDLYHDEYDNNLTRFYEDYADEVEQVAALSDARQIDRDEYLDEEDAFIPEKARDLTSAIEDYVEQTTRKQLEDPVEYLKDMLGDDDGMQTAMKIGGIDIRAAAESAVNTDGSAHYLAGYDGEKISLPGGAVAFRTN